MGAYMDLSVRRTQVAPDDIYKGACRKPKGVKAPKIKNITKTVLGETVGRIHMKKQNLEKVASGRRIAALRVKRPIDATSEFGDNKGGKRRKVG
jgi:ribosome production factor 2